MNIDTASRVMRCVGIASDENASTTMRSYEDSGIARSPSRPSTAVVRIVVPGRARASERYVKYAGFSAMRMTAFVDLEEVHAHTVAGISGKRSGAEADHSDIAEPPFGREREDDIAEWTGWMVVRGRQRTHLAAKRLHTMRRRAMRKDVPVAVLLGRHLVHAKKRALAVQHIATGSHNTGANE